MSSGSRWQPPGQRGSAPFELLATLPMLALVLLLLIQVLVAAWTIGRAEWAAWDGARAYARGASRSQVEAAIRAVVGEQFAGLDRLGQDGCMATVAVRVRIPVKVWFLGSAVLPPVRAEARFPEEGGTCG